MRNILPILILATVLFTIPLYAACNDNPDEEVMADTEETTEDDTLYVCPMHPDETSTDPEARCSVCGMDLVSENEAGGEDTHELYACPMHPEETSTDPEAKCSICGMFLEPVEETMNGGPDTETSTGH